MTYRSGNRAGALPMISDLPLSAGLKISVGIAVDRTRGTDESMPVCRRIVNTSGGGGETADTNHDGA